MTVMGFPSRSERAIASRAASASFRVRASGLITKTCLPVNSSTKEVQGSNVNPVKVGKQIGRFLDHLFKKLGQFNSFDEGKVRLANLIKKSFENKFKGIRESEDSKRPDETGADED